jgi:FkbM family methyltransferase
MISQDFQKWFSDSGDKRHRIYGYGRLKSDDIYFDVGSFTGKFAKQFYDKHRCVMYCFEPIENLYNQTKKTLSNIDKAYCYNFGLGAKTEELEISLTGDSSSLYLTDQAEKTERVKIVAIDEFIKNESIDSIKVIKINIEGAEYDLLDHALDTKITDKMENIQVQFHTFIDDCISRRETIRQRLSETHQLTWDYPFIWENWRRK